jgi:glycine cleavage system H protein
MEHIIQKPSHTGLIATAACLSVAVALPFLAVLAFVLRPVLGIVGIALFAGCILWCALHGRRSEAVVGPASSRQARRGVRLPRDVMLHRSHSWARPERSGERLLVGVDDLLQAALGPVDEIQPLAPGSHVEQDDPLVRLRRRDRWLTVRSPVTGTVLAANRAAAREPTLINLDPYGRGWVVQIRPRAFHEDTRQLRRGPEARTWLIAEAERFIQHASMPEATANGWRGNDFPTDRLYLAIDDEAWSHLTETFVAERVPAGVGP